MPRGSRDFPPDAILHVVNRGVERRQLFADAADYVQFLGFLDYGLSKSHVRLLAYALMPNHWHLLVQAPTPGELSQFMHRVTWRHAAKTRKSTQSAGLGALYQGRFRAHLIDTDRRYLVALRYVEANPVRAGLVARAEDWRWSSLRERLREPRRIVDGPVELPYPREWADIVNGIDRRGAMPEPEEEVWP